MAASGIGTYQAPGPDPYGIFYRGGWSGGEVEPGPPAPKPDMLPKPPPPGEAQPFPNFPDWGTNQPWGGGAGDLPSQPFDVETLDPNRWPGMGPLPSDISLGGARGGGFMDFPTSYTGGAAAGGGAPSVGGTPRTGDAGLRPGTPTITGGKADTTESRAAAAAKQQTGQQQQLLFQKLFEMFTGGKVFTPATVPDFRTEAMQQAELMRKRAGLRSAEEAAATGGAGGRDLAYRQSLLDEAMLNAGGNIGAEQAGRQFQANLQAKSLEAQQQIAQFNQLLKMLAALGGMQG